MNEALIPTAGSTAMADGAPIALPQLIVDAGPAVAERFLEFFAAQLANERTRAAYARAAGRFLTWCEVRGLSLRTLPPLHVSAYIRTHPSES